MIVGTNGSTRYMVCEYTVLMFYCLEKMEILNPNTNMVYRVLDHIRYAFTTSKFLSDNKIVTPLLSTGFYIVAYDCVDVLFES
ncbi:hypothetical protein Hanom_Chr15g01370301 [Helianthus anomalus]